MRPEENANKMTEVLLLPPQKMELEEGRWWSLGTQNCWREPAVRTAKIRKAMDMPQEHTFLQIAREGGIMRPAAAPP